MNREQVMIKFWNRLLAWLFPGMAVFYGPHRCVRCHALICKASFEQGGAEYDYPDGPIYPNTAWSLHECPRA